MPSVALGFNLRAADSFVVWHSRNLALNSKGLPVPITFDGGQLSTRESDDYTDKGEGRVVG